MPRLPHLCDPYAPATFAYLDGDGGDQPARSTTTHRDWIEVFRSATPTFKKHALTDEAIARDADRQAAADAFEANFHAVLDALDADSLVRIAGYEGQPLDCFLLCRVRESCLLAAGFQDIFKAVKQRENDAALAHLTVVLAELDAQDSAAARWGLALRGVFAGNIFDLGASNSAALYDANGAANAFSATRSSLLQRPWVIDDLDRIVLRVCGMSGQRPPYAKAVLFVDNAGSDVVLGMLPLARELLKSGTEVVLAANGAPSCNDITAGELSELLPRAAALDPAVLGAALEAGRLRVVASHHERLPVIDLSALSDGLAAEAASAHLIVLEGMGRAIESNLHARLRVDTWKLGMIKHRPVADSLGGRLYDCVCRFDEAAVLANSDA